MPAGRPRGDVQKQLDAWAWLAEGRSEAPARRCGCSLRAGTRQEQPAGSKRGRKTTEGRVEEGKARRVCRGGERFEKPQEARTARKPSDSAVRPSR